MARKRTRNVALIVVSCVLLLGIGVGGCCLGGAYGLRWGLWAVGLADHPFSFKRKKFESVVRDFQGGKLRVVDDTFEMPAKYRSLVVDPMICVTRGMAWGDAILFQTWQGRGGDLSGYVFFTKGTDPLVPAMASTLYLRRPPLRAMPSPSGDIITVEVTVVEAVAPGWFSVDRRMD